MKVTLRIKRKFFDAIKSGEKKIEYRDGKEFYRNLLGGKKIKRLKLHYQGREYLEVEVKKIELIPLPDRFIGSPFFTTNKIYAIYLGRVFLKGKNFL